MIRIRIPYDKVMVSQEYRESPWGEIDIIDPLLHKWLDDRDPDWNWDFEGPGYDTVIFKVNDAALALMFKLTFG